jgi:hypothetical protein
MPSCDAFNYSFIAVVVILPYSISAKLTLEVGYFYMAYAEIEAAD